MESGGSNRRVAEGGLCKVAGIGRIEGTGSTNHYAVVPSKDGKLIETGDEVPAGSDVASYKDAKGQDREGVHRALLPAEAHADPIQFNLSTSSWWSGGWR